MDIYAAPGTKVRFLGKNGYEHQLEAAGRVFFVEQELTVRRIVIRDFNSLVEFEERPRETFNSVMFGD